MTLPCSSSTAGAAPRLRSEDSKKPLSTWQWSVKINRDLNHWAQAASSRVSGLQQQLPHVPGAATFTHLFNLPRAPELWHWDRAHLLGGVCEGSQRLILLFMGSGECPEQARVLTSSLLAREVLPWQITCFCLWQEMYPCHELSTQWYIGSYTITLYLSVGPLITAVVLILLLKFPEELETHIWSRLREQTCPEIVTVKVVNGLDTSRQSGHTEIDSEGWRWVETLQLRFSTAGLPSLFNNNKKIQLIYINTNFQSVWELFTHRT